MEFLICPSQLLCNLGGLSIRAHQAGIVGSIWASRSTGRGSQEVVVSIRRSPPHVERIIPSRVADRDCEIAEYNFKAKACMLDRLLEPFSSLSLLIPG